MVETNVAKLCDTFEEFIDGMGVTRILPLLREISKRWTQLSASKRDSVNYFGCSATRSSRMATAD